MTTWVRSTLFALGMIGTMAVATAQAQVTEPIRFHTSFPFSVGRVTLPAGDYTVRPLDDMLGVMAISNGRQTVFFDSADAGVRRPGQVTDEVIFGKSGNRYALREILDAADEGGVALPAPVTDARRRGHGGHH